MLVTVEARLLSRKTRGADQILELQADQHVFEAVLGTQAGKTAGVRDRKPAGRDWRLLFWIRHPHPPPMCACLARTRSMSTLLQGPPWWTWQRTVIAIGLLLAVLAASLLRIQILNRRFARQQAARLAFARGMLESQESERRRIAASLHDSLGQDLLVIRNQAHLAIQSSAEQSDSAPAVGGNLQHHPAGASTKSARSPTTCGPINSTASD